MKISTLKTLIEDAFEDVETISQFKSKVLKLIDLYEDESIQDYTRPELQDCNPLPIFGDGEFDKVPYHTICSCNPSHGGSGICGCTMANELVYPCNGFTGITSTSQDFTTKNEEEEPIFGDNLSS